MISNEEVKSEIEKLPLSQELLQYYKEKLENFEKDYEQAVKLMDGCRVSHEEYFNLTRELQKKTKEVTNLQKLLSDAQLAIFDERKELLKVLAENDALKIQEVKDRRKIRYLLGLVDTSDEITYFKKGFYKKFLKKNDNTENHDMLNHIGIGENDGMKNSKVAVPVEGKQNPNKGANGIMDEEVVFDNENIYIVNDEIEGLRLTISSLKAQIEEQRKENEKHIEGYKKDRQFRISENESQQQYYFEQIISLTEKINKLRSICRENTKELIQTKSKAKMLDRKSKSQLAQYAEDMRILKTCFSEQKNKSDDLKKNLEIKFSKKNDDMVNNLRKQLGKYEEELRLEKSKNQNIDEKYKKQIETLNEDINKMRQSKIIEVNQLKLELTKSKVEVKRLENKIKKLESENVSKKEGEDNIPTLKINDIAGSGCNKNNNGDEMNKLKSEIENYKNKISEMNIEIKKNEELRHQNILFTQKLQEAQKKLLLANQVITKAKKYSLCLAYMSQFLGLIKPEGEKQVYLVNKLKEFIDENQKEKK